MKIINFTLGLLLLSQIAFSQGTEFDGYALYNKQGQNTAYLIDKDGDIAHIWNCSLPCNYSVLLKEDGNIIRGTQYSSNYLGGAAEGGQVQEIDSNGNIIWDFIYSDETHLSHHDITLVNNNVLLTAWEVVSQANLTQAGYDGASSEKWPTHFVEVAHDGDGGGEIVWEWHLMDHLIQDHDSSKDYYGVVAAHPELFDINMIEASGGGPGGGPGGGQGGGDWFHVNGVNYNPELDQIAFCSRHTSEVYIIDHSTSSSEAASHTGGNAGMGGDLLYRWGNPSNYDAPGVQQITSAVHDVRWIDNDGRPNGGFLQFFNNSGVVGNSTIDAIETPLNGYNYDLVEGQAYGPTSHSWRHICEGYSSGQSSHNRMSNGNIFVNMSAGQNGSGYMYEADSSGNIVWLYNAGPAATEKAFRYECKNPGIIALLGEDSCDENNIALSEEFQSSFVLAPNPSSGIFEVIGELEKIKELRVINSVGLLIKEQISPIIDLSNMPNGIYFVEIIDQEGNLKLNSISLRN
jgi:hypothetical protein